MTGATIRIAIGTEELAGDTVGTVKWRYLEEMQLSSPKYRDFTVALPGPSLTFILTNFHLASSLRASYDLPILVLHIDKNGMSQRLCRRPASVSSIALSKWRFVWNGISLFTETVRREDFEGKNRVKTLSSNGDLSVCSCEFSNMQISTSQKLRSVEHCAVRYVLKHHPYIDICISNTFYVNV